MKQLIRLSVISSLAFNTLAFAANPMPGFYGGLLGEISHGPDSYFIVMPDFILPPVTPIARVNNNKIGGGGGAQIGYRLCNFRAEAELLFNYINSQSLNVGTCTLLSPLVPFTGDCLEDSFLVNGTGFKGNTAALYGMINAYYDFLRTDPECNIVPYIGLGIGAVRIRDTINFVNTTLPLPLGVNSSYAAKANFNSTAAQGILGVNVFLDDFTWIAMDYRYLATGTINSTGTLSTADSFLIPDNIRYALHTLNFTINFSFDKCTN